MRLFKFRVFDKLIDSLVDDAYWLTIGLNGKIINEEMEYEEGRFVLQQFTGVIDIDNVCIYEGDIVLNLDTYENYYSPCVIVMGQYEQMQWSLGIKKTDKNLDYLNSIYQHINGIWIQEEWPLRSYGYMYKVIGNIYENPELLNVSPEKFQKLYSL